MATIRPFHLSLPCGDFTPLSVFHRLARDREYAFLLESAEPKHIRGRYSFIGFDPLFLFSFSPSESCDPLLRLEDFFREHDFIADPLLPAFQGSLVGYLNYEVVRHFERLQIPVDPDFPEGIFFFPKFLVIFDHLEKNIILVAYSAEDLEYLKQKFDGNCESESSFFHSSSFSQVPSFGLDAGYIGDVENAQESILAGDIFQVVLSKEFTVETDDDPFVLYSRLRNCAPSPYMYYLQYPSFAIIGSSPETLVRTEGDDVVIRPIAGTRKRGKSIEEDRLLEEELLGDPKEQAEHMMLVDLGRNDIGRIAEPGSVRVVDLMHVERYRHVMHLVTEVRGRRAKNVSMFDIFRATFPAGTLSGAPKIRAMEIIAQLEKSPRRIYGGAVGYFSFSGQMDFAIAIRTMLYRNAQFPSSRASISVRAGAGIVFDSVPELELRECQQKATSPLSVCCPVLINHSSSL